MAPRGKAACYYPFYPSYLATRLSGYIATWLHGYAKTIECEKSSAFAIHRLLFLLIIILIILVQILIGAIRQRNSIHTCLPSYRVTRLHGYIATRLRTGLTKGKGTPRKVPLLMGLEARRLIRIDRRDAPTDPSHDGNGHGVADCLVARSVGTFLGGFALPGD